MNVVPTPLATLGPPFAEQVPTTPLPAPYWVAWNGGLAQTLGLSSIPSLEYLDILAGQTTKPAYCSVYAGHQFGYWAGQLGDGRAHSLGQLKGTLDSWEIQLKGAGPTPFSRRGDGRAVLRSSIREYLASEAMAGLGIPTTRALAITGSNLTIWREQPETAAIVTRLAPSFIRFGHFEHFAAQGDEAALHQLVHAVTAHDPLLSHNTAHAALTLLTQATLRTAELIACWQAVGFCHGVLNTDNMSILGLTLDYGPFGFMDRYIGTHVCNHSDTHGRYAYDQQPHVGLWNCSILAQSLQSLIRDDTAIEGILSQYGPHYRKAWLQRFSAKLGLMSENSDNASLILSLLTLMEREKVDFTRFFRALSSDDPRSTPPLEKLFKSSGDFVAWWAIYEQRLEQDNTSVDECRQRLLQVNPKYVLRNHLAELTIRSARQGDFTMIDTLKQVLDSPYEEHPDHEEWAADPPPWSQQLSISCSS
ncbi:MAG: YdiU family protein [Betaproteobacteria bacterium]|jgi:Uncharacterized conserved protein|nr:YdiU family protein [Betaproteobacteria bacterium]